jgi:hypothetical protein
MQIKNRLLLGICLTIAASSILAVKFRSSGSKLNESGPPPRSHGDHQSRGAGNDPDSRERLDPRLPQSPAFASGVVINGVVAPDFTEEVARITRYGDYSGFSRKLSNLEPNQRMTYAQRIPELFSPLGPAHDVAEKIKLIGVLDAPIDYQNSTRDAVFRQEGKRRFDEVVKSGLIQELHKEDFSAMCVALSTVSLARGFDAVADGADAEMQRFAARKVASFSMMAGPLEASKEISQLPAGFIRDEIVAEMVLFLKRTGSPDDAAAWADTIIDEQAKQRVQH